MNGSERMHRTSWSPEDNLRFAAIALAVVLGSAGSARAEAERTPFEYGEIEAVFTDPLDVEGRPGAPEIGLSYFEWKDAFGKETGINYVIEDRLINQWGDGASIYDNELNLIVRWDVFADDTFGAGSLNVWGQFAQSIGGHTAGRFQSDLGVLSPLNGGNGGPGSTNEILQMLAWEQILANGRFRIQFGKLAMRTLVNLNRYANGDSEMFFSPMLGNNPVAPYTALLGLGVFAQWREDDWYVSGVVRAPDTKLGISFDALGDGDIAYIVEFGFTPEIEGLGRGEYRLTLSYDEDTATRPDVFTVSLSADQDIGEHIGAFFRYARGDTFRSFENRVAAGFQVLGPFGYADDRIGAGFWWGDPVSNALNDEYGLEFFYRVQLTRALQITPDVQFVFDPALTNDDVKAVFGLRFRLVL